MAGKSKETATITQAEAPGKKASQLHLQQTTSSDSPEIPAKAFRTLGDSAPEVRSFIPEIVKHYFQSTDKEADHRRAREVLQDKTLSGKITRESWFQLVVAVFALIAFVCFLIAVGAIVWITKIWWSAFFVSLPPIIIIAVIIWFVKRNQRK